MPRDDLHFTLTEQYLNPLINPRPFPPPPRHSLENVEFSAGDIEDFGQGRNLRPTKTPQAEISGRKHLRPKPLESIPQLFLPLPFPSNKAGWAFPVNCSEITLTLGGILVVQFWVQILLCFLVQLDKRAPQYSFIPIIHLFNIHYWRKWHKTNIVPRYQYHEDDDDDGDSAVMVRVWGFRWQWRRK